MKKFWKLKIHPPVVDYRKWRPCLRNSDEFQHLKLLLFWPLYGLLFLIVERFYTANFYYPTYCVIDDIIPFCEFFVIPYVFWFVYLIGMHIYTLLYDIETFKEMMKFVIFTFSIAIAIYFVFPTCQNLRPKQFNRNNFFTRFLTKLYRIDTNTNVCPSIHVIGSFAVAFAAFHCKRLKGIAWKIGFGIATFLICASTVLIKQHSLIDTIVSIPICLIGYYIFFVMAERKKV